MQKTLSLGRYGLSKILWFKILAILDSFRAKSELALLPGMFVPIQTLSTSQQ